MHFKCHPIDCHSGHNYLTKNMTHSWFTSSLYIVSEAYAALSHLAVSNCFSKHRNSIFNFSITGYQSEKKLACVVVGVVAECRFVFIHGIRE